MAQQPEFARHEASQAPHGASAAQRDESEFRDNLGIVVGPMPETDFAGLGVRLTADPDEPFGLIMLLPGGDLRGFFETAGSRRRALVMPVADFSGTNHPRAEFGAADLNLETVATAFEQTQDIRNRLRRIPAPRDAREREPLLALAMAASRNTSIDARWTASLQELVGYPLLDGFKRPRSLLERLAQAGLLKRRFFDRLHVCGDCGSSRLAAREVCTGCESPRLRDEPLIHHYRCGYQGPRSQYEDERSLVCPKCNRVLRHYGLDYDAPGHIKLCGQCGVSSSEPLVNFRCADCQRDTAGDDIGSIDWHHYDVTPAGEAAVIEARLPGWGVHRLAEGMAGHRSPRDFAMMVEFAAKLNRRYERPFSVILINLLRPADETSADQDRAELLVEDIVKGVVRDTDFVAGLEHQLALFLPETPMSGAEILAGRLNERVGEAMGQVGRIKAEVIEPEKIQALVDLMRQQ